MLEPRPAVESPGVAPAVPLERDGPWEGAGAGVEGFVDARAQPESASVARMTFRLIMWDFRDRVGSHTHVHCSILISYAAECSTVPDVVAR